MSKKPQTFGVTMDRRLNQELRNETAQGRGRMIEAAEGNPLPERFTAARHKHNAFMVLTDTQTGRTSEVPLHAYGAARALLNDLYGPPKPTAKQRFEELGLPLEVEGDGFRAVACQSPFQAGEIMYRVEVEGFDGGEEGVARIVPRFREGTLEFAVWDGPDYNGFIVNDSSLEQAIETVRLDVMPDLLAGGPRP